MDSDDNDGVVDRLDAHPYDASNTQTAYTYSTWEYNDYASYSGQVNFVEMESLYHPGNETSRRLLTATLMVGTPIS